MEIPCDIKVIGKVFVNDKDILSMIESHESRLELLLNRVDEIQKKIEGLEKSQKSDVVIDVKKEEPLTAAKPVAPPVAKPVAPPVAKPVAPPVAPPVAKPVAPPVAKPVAPPVAKPVAPPVVAESVAAPVVEQPAVVADPHPQSVSLGVNANGTASRGQKGYSVAKAGIGTYCVKYDVPYTKPPVVSASSATNITCKIMLSSRATCLVQCVHKVSKQVFDTSLQITIRQSL